MKTPEQLKQEVLHGLWGDGDTRRQRLENAGYSWIEIQSLINKQFGSKAVIASDEEIAQRLNKHLREYKKKTLKNNE